MIERHLKVYLRDKGAVLSSLVAVFVTIALYIFFLGNYLESTIMTRIGENKGIFVFVNAWVLSGILVVCSLTISLGLFGVKVQDEQNDVFKSFSVTPISKMKIVTSYIVAAWTISYVLTSLVFIVWLLVMAVLGYQLVNFVAFFEILFYIALNVFSATSLTFCLANFIKSANAFSSVSTVVGTLTGFLAGIYLPIGSLPVYVQMVMKFFPPTYGVAQIRERLTKMSLEAITRGDSEKYIHELKLDLGINIELFNITLSNQILIPILLVSGIVFWLISIIYLRGRLK